MDMSEARPRQLQRVIDENAALVKKWSSRLNAANTVYKRIRGVDLSEHTQGAIARILENTYDFLYDKGVRVDQSGRLLETTYSGDLGAFPPYAFPLLTAVSAALIANEIVSVQPIDKRKGYIYYLDFIRGITKGKLLPEGGTIFSPITGVKLPSFKYSSNEIEDEEATGFVGDDSTLIFANIPLSYGNIIPGTFAGSIVIGGAESTFIDDGANGITGADVASGSIVYTSPAKFSITFGTGKAPDDGEQGLVSYNVDLEKETRAIGSVDAKVREIPVTAVPRKLNTRFLMDAAFDFSKGHGRDLEVEVLAAMGSLLRAEIDGGILDDLLVGAYADNKVQWEISVPTEISMRDHYESFVEAIIQASHNIYQQTLLGYGNFLVCGEKAARIVTFLGRPRFEPASGLTVAPPTGPFYLGILDGRWKTYYNPYYAATKSVVGFNGETFLQSGYVFAPYVPVYVTPALVDETFTSRRGMMSMFAKKMVQSKMYAEVEITGS